MSANGAAPNPAPPSEQAPAPNTAPAPGQQQQPDNSSSSNNTNALSPEQFRIISEQYKKATEENAQMKAMMEQFKKEHLARQRPLLEKAITNFSKIAGTPDAKDPNVMMLDESVAKFISDQFAGVESTKMQQFLVTLSDKWDEAGAKFEDLTAKSTGYQQQLATLGAQHQEATSTIAKLNAQIADLNRQLANTSSGAQTPNNLGTVFRPSQKPSAIDGLVGNAGANKRNHASAFANSALAGALYGGLKEQAAQPVDVNASANPGGEEEERPAKKSRTEKEPNVPATHAALFNTIAGIKSSVTLRDPYKYSTAL